ncbi:family 20 glycosylhydrolase [Macrococcus equipercicus]|uniref:beta-N-acetylhexosaminidase n=1 Tax=Macrococcus equipercicus TaxID=69967 RepID=A0ABQ6RAX9_9STAP|nr:family 20 glycosylhydrolase [Macrococcus equipercicus]KAA1042341.1 family 20 glycosylhydrolase [Macrococcus equipercicus]
MIKKTILSTVLTLISFIVTSLSTAEAAAYDRGVTIDIARKYHSLSTLKAIVDEMKANNAAYLQLHFSDNENYALASPYLYQTSNITNSRYLTAGELAALITYCNDRDIIVIPDIDMPAHSAAWTVKVAPRLKAGERITTDFDSSVVDYFGNTVALTHSKALLTEVMTQFKQPKFYGRQRIVIGGDEVTGGYAFQDELLTYINQLAAHTVQAGYKPQLWNDSLTKSGLSGLNKSVSILYWSQRGDTNVTVEDFAQAGLSVYNYNAMSLYFLPDSRCAADITEQAGYIQRAYKINHFYENGEYYYPVTTFNIAGSALTFWGEHAGELSQQQLLEQELPLIRSYLTVQ